jgi:hypothetical protein
MALPSSSFRNHQRARYAFVLGCIAKKHSMINKRLLRGFPAANVWRMLRCTHQNTAFCHHASVKQRRL